MPEQTISKKIIDEITGVVLKAFRKTKCIRTPTFFGFNRGRLAVIASLPWGTNDSDKDKGLIIGRKLIEKHNCDVIAIAAEAWLLSSENVPNLAELTTRPSQDPRRVDALVINIQSLHASVAITYDVKDAQTAQARVLQKTKNVTTKNEGAINEFFRTSTSPN